MQNWLFYVTVSVFEPYEYLLVIVTPPFQFCFTYFFLVLLLLIDKQNYEKNFMFYFVLFSKGEFINWAIMYMRSYLLWTFTMTFFTESKKDI